VYQGQSGRAENFVPTGIRSPDGPARKSVTILTELTDLFVIKFKRNKSVDSRIDLSYIEL